MEIGVPPDVRLRRLRRIATGTLLGVGAVWVGTFLLPVDGAAIGYIRAGAEAGLVGGLADWFAVTALFRHPLGIPIPHTNLIHENREGIAKNIATYIDTVLLEPKNVIERIRRYGVANNLAAFLSDPSNRREIADIGGQLALFFLQRQNNSKISAALSIAIKNGLDGADLKPTLRHLSQHIVSSSDLPTVAASISRQIRYFVLRNRNSLARVALRASGEKLSWWKSYFVDRKSVISLIKYAGAEIEKYGDATTAEGAEAVNLLEKLPSTLLDSPARLEAIEQWLQRLFDDKKLRDLVQSTWAECRDILEKDVESPSSKIKEAIDAMLGQFAAELDSLSLRSRLDDTAEAVLIALLPFIKTRISEAIEEILLKQDPKVFVDRIEKRVGSDLQFIRLNGTAIGAIIGVALYWIASNVPAYMNLLGSRI